MSTFLSVSELWKIFPGGVEAVRGVSLSIARGELFAFLGPNGAGKSTTIRMICGLCRPSSGRIEIDGNDPVRNRSAYTRCIGLVSQHFNVNDDLTAYENMLIHAKLHGLRGRSTRLRILELLRLAGLEDQRDRLAGILSGGMKRKLQIVRSMLHEPRMLFLDEPSAGLDPMSRERIWNLIHELNASGVTVFFTSHYIDEAERHAERLAIIHRGRIVKTGVPAALIEELGPWCRESFGKDATRREHYRSREEAEAAMNNGYQRLVIRRTQLEDVFIRIVGATLEESDDKPANGG